MPESSKTSPNRKGILGVEAKNLVLKMQQMGAAELLHWLGALVALADDLGSIPGTHMEAHNCLNSDPRGSNTLF